MRSAFWAILPLALFAQAALAREQIQISGSSTVMPYATIAAETFGENSDFPVPVVESGGTAGGLKKLCAGLGENTIDIANASRPMRASEHQVCVANGVSEIIELRIGYDGIVIAGGIQADSFDLTPADWFNALAEKVVRNGKIVPNPYENWHDIRPDLPDQPILAYIPGTKHGTREVLDATLTAAGCAQSGAAAAFGSEKVPKACLNLRRDNRVVEIDGDYTEILARVGSDPNGLGVFGLSFYDNNTDKLRVATISGVSPSAQTIASGAYPVARPLYLYVKKAHIGRIAGLKEFAAFFVSDDMAGPDGPLAEYGLVPDPDLAEVQRTIADEVTMP